MSAADTGDVRAATLAGILERLAVTHPHLGADDRARKASRVLAMLERSRDPSWWTTAVEP